MESGQFSADVALEFYAYLCSWNLHWSVTSIETLCSHYESFCKSRQQNTQAIDFRVVFRELVLAQPVPLLTFQANGMISVGPNMQHQINSTGNALGAVGTGIGQNFVAIPNPGQFAFSGFPFPHYNDGFNFGGSNVVSPANKLPFATKTKAPKAKAIPDYHFCGLCAINSGSLYKYQEHLASRRHVQNLLKLDNPVRPNRKKPLKSLSSAFGTTFHCFACPLTFTSLGEFNAHAAVLHGMAATPIPKPVAKPATAKPPAAVAIPSKGSSAPNAVPSTAAEGSSKQQALWRAGEGKNYFCVVCEKWIGNHDRLDLMIHNNSQRHVAAAACKGVKEAAALENPSKAISQDSSSNQNGANEKSANQNEASPAAPPKELWRSTHKKNYFCFVCEKWIGNHGGQNLQLHNKSEKHLQATAVKQSLQGVTLTANGPANTAATKKLGAKAKALRNRLLKKGFCRLCQVDCNTEEDLKIHMAGVRHKGKLRLVGLINSLESYIAGEPGVLVTLSGANVSFDAAAGKASLACDENSSGAVEILIANNKQGNACSDVRLVAALLLTNPAELQLSDTSNVSKKMSIADTDYFAIIPANGFEYKLTVTYKFPQVGKYVCPVVLKFTKQSDPEAMSSKLESFTVVRFMEFAVTNALVKELQPNEPFKEKSKAKKATVEVSSVFFPGMPLKEKGTAKLEKILKLETYEVPDSFKQIMGKRGLAHAEDMDADDELLRQFSREIRDCLYQPVTPANHLLKFSSLLYIEELYLEREIKQHDLESAMMEPVVEDKSLVALKVPDLAECRPSLMKGDSVFVRSAGKSKPYNYEGIVHSVRQDEVWLGFCAKFRQKFSDRRSNLSCDVRFSFSRYTLRMQHRALCLAKEFALESVIHPGAKGLQLSKSLFSGNSITCFNPRVQSNREQFQAVKQILRGTCRPAPYLIFGPPGTGKTMTVVESIKQVLANLPNSNVLACAPSNAAADILVQRLIEHIQPAFILRLNAVSREVCSIPHDILECCNVRPFSNQIYVPAKKELLAYRIVVTTLVTAGRLVSAAFPAGHFSHVYIDEAGQATEPETLIPIAGLYDPKISKGLVIIAGDPKQLGAVIQSGFAALRGLGCSMIERLMTTCSLYQRGEDDNDGTRSYNPAFLTKLVENYRSHELLLSVPNKLFYENELKPCADKAVVHSMCAWPHLPKAQVPLIFHGVVGEEMREKQSPSFFNAAEVSVVMDYVDKLLAGRDARGILRVAPWDIGIISPYKRQVVKIRDVLRRDANRYGGIKVGSAEEFQGGERHVVILSTVRSNPQFLLLDAKHRLGFLRNPKRFNTAITRAKALLIVVGNPILLQEDPIWKHLIKHCCALGAYRGIPYSAADREEDDAVLAEILGRVDWMQELDAHECPKDAASSSEEEECVSSLPCSSATSSSADFTASNGSDRDSFTERLSKLTLTNNDSGFLSDNNVGQAKFGNNESGDSSPACALQ